MDSAAFDERMVSDWLGLAGYLAEAIAAGDVTVLDAHAELRAALDGAGERHALVRATQLAHEQLGAESRITMLLDDVIAALPPVAEVA